MMFARDRMDLQSLQAIEQRPEDPGRFFSHSMKERRPAFRPDELRRGPFRPLAAEQCCGLQMPAIPPVHEGDEDSGVEKRRCASRCLPVIDDRIDRFAVLLVSIENAGE